ncbi:thiosulfate:glutathione sulfurtransferase-like [Coregonus clupeaformis]|uniref:thiosulfate:glutathione sulfurtransferase-like n=1 Tax=Coregonus clupeaformis TaxID=59861 RepID=UPI001BE0D33E|nr:thiosulfate:glutathione sulfurtransferase-like [Coregonus clupeaformis]
MANSDKDISYSDLKALLDKSNKGLLVVDVRTKEEVDRGHIPGSIHIPVDTVESALALDPTEFQAKYGVPKPPLDTPELVFHCQMGRRGGVATDKARGLGFQKDVNYAGGYKEWSEKEGKWGARLACIVKAGHKNAQMMLTFC